GQGRAVRTAARGDARPDGQGPDLHARRRAAAPLAAGRDRGRAAQLGIPPDPRARRPRRPVPLCRNLRPPVGGDDPGGAEAPLPVDGAGRDRRVPAPDLGPMILYRLCQGIVRAGWPLVGRLHVRGTEHVPASGPFLLIANHQSILDPILIQTFCPRTLHTMAKSTQFASPPMRWLMPRLKSFPVRRFEPDPQAVRLALRRLQEGHGVGIYIEGERSWDGRLQAPRRGT